MNKHNQGIRKESLRLILIISAIMVILSSLLGLYIDDLQNKLMADQEYLEKKTAVADELGHSLYEVILRARGYYAFKNDYELVLLNKHLDILEEKINQFSKMAEEEEDRNLASELEEFYQKYRFGVLPKGLALANANDYGALQKLSHGESGDLVNGFLLRINSYKDENISKLNKANEVIMKKSNSYTLISALLFSLGFIALSIAMWVILNRIIKPIEELDAASQQLALGKPISFTSKMNPKNEIGKLMHSFSEMAKSLQSKEEELMTQNEELQAQQLELEEHQQKLQTSLNVQEKTTNRLERLNKLNHDLTFTLDQQKLINSIQQYLQDLYPFDASIFWTTDEKIYASHGLSDETIKRVVNENAVINKARLKQERAYVIKRTVTNEENGIAEQPFYAYDLYSGVFDSNDEILAVFCATRLGSPIHEEEIEELIGILQRVSLSIGRILVYKQIESSRKLNQDIVNNVNEGIQFVDINGTMLQFNETLCNNILQTDWVHNSEIPVHEWIETFLDTADNKEELEQFFNDAMSEKTTEVMNLCYSIKQPKETFLNVYASPVCRNNERVGTIFVHRDITKEHEVDQMKSELVSTVSHELRTPLSSVLGFTELLLNKKVTPERQYKYLTTIQKEAQRLTNLINNFLDIQRMESGKQQYDMSNCRIGEITLDVIHQFIHEKNHSIYLVDEAANDIVRCDKDRLVQVLTNLVSNAIKFSPYGGTVEIALRNNHNQLVISVSDEGLGISEQDIHTLFQKFKRIDNSERRKIGGTGLGLAISKEIIEQHGGRIWIESKEGKGTTVFITLPVIERQTEQHEDLELNHTGLNVIMVEDDSSIALLLSDELKRKGFNVIHHYNPEMAYQEALKLPLVGFVIDLMLGDDMNGWDLIKKLKSTDKTKNIPIIISSALDIDENNMNRYNIEKYLTKPYPPDELSKTIDAIVQASISGGNGEVLFPKI
ncbi:ATP-binding protein [Lederbergia wuyishanensis]|uniref:histidine kinase n=1 Tax=Lederbergia wuyishanensis TaxID=1347903 RepID=A0ABU0D5V9_9BACI|nr:ATP-binding protein [Lederbergia wuyishanensis]MCJ8008376.1 ATP-binding protein [Lederbergia wuyishanensis]MDQ0343790.1 signal transduction histidine kinase/CheY-like chemotaxis protein [Lederbergia wuyishanensis]